MAIDIHGDPRGRTEDEWLDTLDAAVARLASATRARLEVGGYRVIDGPKRASFTVRVRSREPLPEVESDNFEAVISLDGNGHRVAVDADVFPFLDGSVVTRRGRLADLGIELDELVSMKLEGEAFTSRGWVRVDNPGEWSWVMQPGDEFKPGFSCEPLDAYQEGAPMPLAIGIAPPVLRAARRAPGTIRFSLVAASRSHTRGNLVPWGERPARSGSPRAIAFDASELPSSGWRIQLDALSIRGGWRRGDYRVVARIQNLDREGWTWSSDISAPFDLRIA